MKIKKKERNQLVSYDTLLRTFKAEIIETEKFKKHTILKLAKKLEEELAELHKINDRICEDLDGYVSRQYIGQCLDKKYKQQEKITASPKKKKKEKAIEIATNGSVLSEEETDKAEFYRGMDKEFDASDQRVRSLNDTVVKELNTAIIKQKELESKLASTITEEEYLKIEKQVTAYEGLVEQFKNHVGEFVKYDENLEITNVIAPHTKDSLKINLRKFENKIKQSFKLGKASATIEYEGSHATDWT